MDLNTVLKDFLNGGWDGLEDVGALAQRLGQTDSERVRAEMERERAIMRAAFTTPEGRAALDLLVRKTLARGENAEQLGARTAEAYAIAGARRAGQNSILFMIFDMLRDERHPVPLSGAQAEGET